MNCFDKLYNKIILEEKTKSKFKKGDEVFVSINKKPVSGKITKINHDKEIGITYDVDINLPDGPKTFLEKDVSEKNNFERIPDKRKNKKLLKANSEELASEEGECAGGSTPMGPGITGDTVFGSGNTACDSLVEPKEKTDKDPGLTTSDIANLYTLQKGSPCIGTFKRHRKRK